MQARRYGRFGKGASPKTPIKSRSLSVLASNEALFDVCEGLWYDAKRRQLMSDEAKDVQGTVEEALPNTLFRVVLDTGRARALLSRG